MPHFNLVLATPGSHLQREYVWSLLDTLDAISRAGLSWTWANDYSSHVAMAREVTLSGSLDNDLSISAPGNGGFTYDKILWIDSDIAWTPQDAMALYDAPEDIISGCYLTSPETSCALNASTMQFLTADEVRVLDRKMQVGAVGMGFVCVKTGVFESLSRPWFQQAWFTTEATDMLGSAFPILGEDISWSKRVRDAGFDIWLDPQVKVMHKKSAFLGWR